MEEKQINQFDEHSNPIGEWDGVFDYFETYYKGFFIERKFTGYYKPLYFMDAKRNNGAYFKNGVHHGYDEVHYYTTQTTSHIAIFIRFH